MDLIRLEVNPNTSYCWHNRSVFWSERDGNIRDPNAQGFYADETRLLSRLEWQLQAPSYLVESSRVVEHSQLSYLIAPPDKHRRFGADQLREAQSGTESTIQLLLATAVWDGFHQDVEITNFSMRRRKTGLRLLYAADFADWFEVSSGRRMQKGKTRVAIEQNGPSPWIRWDYEAHHQGKRTTRGIRLDFSGLPPGTRLNRKALTIQLALQPHQTVHICIRATGFIDERVLHPPPGCFSYYQIPEEREQRCGFESERQAHAATGERPAAQLEASLLRAQRDLTALRLFDTDHPVSPAGWGWVPNAGVPRYFGIFGRDELTVAWQAGLFTTSIMEGALHVMRQWQSHEDNAWRDAEPGKMLHEARIGPAAALNYVPQGRYYGEVTSSPFSAIVLSELYHWTGDLDRARAHLPAIRDAMAWVDRYGDLNNDGLYEYRTRSSQGLKNQAWKDSGDAIVYPDGRIVKDPIATCEEQGFVYEAKLRFAELLWVTGDRAEAARQFFSARALKKRFNDHFWMEKERYFALALDRRGKQVRSIASNAGDALATGILDQEHVPDTVARLFSQELFTGWGVRTLSSLHPAFDPYSYHRGSVWPAENAAILVGLRRYGVIPRVHQLLECLLEVSRIFPFDGLPEVFSGHQKDERHPFPAVYPHSCSPQAWSAGAILVAVQMMLGLYPYAPLKTLFYDPHLPDWLPEFTLRHIRVGEARLDLRFYRTPQKHGEAKTEIEVLEQHGTVHLIRQASPWSLYSSPLRRVEDLIDSLAA